MIPLRKIETNFVGSNGYVAGLDEVGRGAWAGPMVAAAVIIPPGAHIAGVRDSKLLSEEQREEVAYDIRAHALTWSYGVVSQGEIDSVGLTEANRLAFARALLGLYETVAHILVDGKYRFRLPYPATFIVQGDRTEFLIAAASVLAKVFRDSLMRHAHILYPDYGFREHKGYGTRRHSEAIKDSGITSFHRQSFIRSPEYPGRSPLRLAEERLSYYNE